MDKKEIKALVSLLDDEDSEVATLVEQKIRSLGRGIIPFLETEWEGSFSPMAQRRIEELIHELQLSVMIERLTEWKNGGALDLLEGMWIVATYQYPDLGLEKLQAEIDQLRYRVWEQCSEEGTPVAGRYLLNPLTVNRALQALGDEGLLESRRGNPITLCVIYLLIARKLNIPVYGVNLPNLFVLTYKKDKTQFYINVFNRGIIFSKTDIDHYITQLNLSQKESFYQPCSSHRTCSRAATARSESRRYPVVRVVCAAKLSTEIACRKLT